MRYILNRYIKVIKNSSPEGLKEEKYLSDLLLKLGMNNENLTEIPKELHKYCGYGFKYWQYPNQFSKYLIFLSNYKITSYLEIGVRHGGTFIITLEYLMKLNNTIKEAIGIDIDNSVPLVEYSRVKSFVKYLKIDSSSLQFKNIINNKKFDLVLIDGNHDENYCRNDYLIFKNISNIIVFHDVASDACPGVIKVWNEIKKNYNYLYEFYEFVDQYLDFYNQYKKKYFGIGIAVRKNWINAESG